MTINKSQGQSLSVCGVNLETPCFSHGQLYATCSRVGKPSVLFVLAPNNKTNKKCI
jgi:PIF1 helicase.